MPGRWVERRFPGPVSVRTRSCLQRLRRATVSIRDSGKAVQVAGASTSDGAAVDQSTDRGGAGQQWQLVKVGAVSNSLPTSFSWVSTGVLAGPRSDASHRLMSLKDFSVIRYNGKYHVYATTANAASATQHYLDSSAIGTRYAAAPQVFYFAPQKLWYMVYQTGPPTYSTTTGPSNPSSWSAPKTFIASEPDVVTQNKGKGQWIDFWTICDTANCHLFFSDDNGHLYRARTTLANFPFRGVQHLQGVRHPPVPVAGRGHGSGRPLLPLLDLHQPGRYLVPARVHRKCPVRWQGQRLLQRTRLGQRHQPRRTGPHGHRSEPGHRPLPPAVRLPGTRSAFRQRLPHVSTAGAPIPSSSTTSSTTGAPIGPPAPTRAQ